MKNGNATCRLFAVPAPWRRKPPATVAGVMIAWLSAAVPAHAVEYDIDFDAYGGGLYLAHGSLQLTLQPQSGERRYSAHLDAVGNRIITFFTGFSYQASAAGRLGLPTVAPKMFRGERTLHARHDIMMLSFDGKNVQVRADPPLSPEKIARVPPQSRRGSLDPLSVGIAVIATAGTARACTGTYPTFDGRRRYDIIMTPIGRTTLTASPQSPASGPALACSVALHPVAGFQTDMDPGKFFADHTDRHATVWFARLRPADPIVPVRVEIDTNFGVFFVHAVSVTIKP